MGRLSVLCFALFLLPSVSGLRRSRSLNLTVTPRNAAALTVHSIRAAANGSQPRLTLEWSGAYGGVPPLADANVNEFEPALLYGIERRRSEVHAIADSLVPATFDNTIAALEDTGRELSRALTVYDVYLSTMSTPELREVEGKMAGPLTAIDDETYQNEKLFLRIKSVYEGPEYKTLLTPEQQRLTWKIYTDFVRNGAELNSGQKTHLAELNQLLAAHYTDFRHNLLADEAMFVLIDDERSLKGLEPGLFASLAEAATESGHPGKWAVTNTRSVVEPFLSQAEDRSLRQQVWQKFVTRGDTADHDNKPHIVDILKLRADRAQLLGYETHAHWQLENSMAHTPAHVMHLLEEVWSPAVATARQEVHAQESIAKSDGSGIQSIEPWDYRFYMEKVKKAKYDLDESVVKPYLQLDHLREGMFWTATKLYALKFSEIHDVPVAHRDTRVWEVFSDSGTTLGLFYFEPFARPGKRSGAWMNGYRSQEKFRGRVLPIVSNNCNYIKPAAGEASLVSWTDAETMFHEFGHALHGLMSDVEYPTLSGTNVARDYVEFPSQLYEHWLNAPEVLERFAVHVETGEAIPQDLVKKIVKAKTFDMGFSTVEYLASAFMDMKLHLAGTQQIDPAAFEVETLKSLGMPHEIVMRHRLPQFAHAFASDGYSAAYYSYLWADTLTADAAEAFDDTGDVFDPATALRLRQDVLTVGNSIDPAEGFKKFRGRDVRIEALMRSRGFAS